VSEKTRPLWQAVVSTSVDYSWYFMVNSIGKLSMIRVFNFPCPFTFTYFICF